MVEKDDEPEPAAAAPRRVFGEREPRVRDRRERGRPVRSWLARSAARARGRRLPGGPGRRCTGLWITPLACRGGAGLDLRLWLQREWAARPGHDGQGRAAPGRPQPLVAPLCFRRGGRLLQPGPRRLGHAVGLGCKRGRSARTGRRASAPPPRARGAEHCARCGGVFARTCVHEGRRSHRLGAQRQRAGGRAEAARGAIWSR